MGKLVFLPLFFVMSLFLLVGSQPSYAGNAGKSSGGFSSNDIRLISNAVYGESRGEPYVGQVAVAAVILNRLEDKRFPNTVSGVIFQPGAFTAVADGQIYLTPNATAKKAVLDAINGMDPSSGCNYYFNPQTATSKWIWSRPQVKKIGKHIFCR
jgi:N-acetylmuramoyl-L-alanine amidase